MLWRTIAGKFPLLDDPAAENDPEYFRKLAEDYLARQRAAGWGKVPFLVDKMLGNYMNIGMIHLMFPKATILHSVRDPVDTCLGCFRQLFRTGNETTYDLRDVGEQYVRYRGMMAHWDAVLPGRVIDVVHEELVSDPDTKIRWLIEDACKLKWDDNCLRFHQTKRAVRTASVAQVRQPIFTARYSAGANMPIILARCWKRSVPMRRDESWSRLRCMGLFSRFCSGTAKPLDPLAP